MTKKENLLSISKRTGFSISTVSRVLSGKGAQYRICQKTIDLITEEAKRCNYTPDLIAKSLRTKHTNTIGLTVPSISNPFFAILSSIIINLFKDYGYNVLLADSMENEQDEIMALQSFVSRKVDGIITVPVSTSPSFHEKISKIIPVVLIDRYFVNTTLPYVCTDNYTGGIMATKLLLQKGYKNILAIQGVINSMPSKERARGFYDTVTGNNIIWHIEGNDFSVKNGYTQTKKALESKERPDAIFAFSNTIMLGALTAIKEKKLQIPKDIAIISFDNNNFLDYLDPPITRIEQPVLKIGQEATKIVINMIKKQSELDQSSKQILIHPTIIEGKSC